MESNPIKSTTTTEGGKTKKKEKRIYRASQNIRMINVFLESLLSESFPSLGVTPPYLCHSVMSNSATPWSITHQAPLSMGFFQTILEWVAMSSSRGSSQPKDQTHVSYIGRCVL